MAGRRRTKSISNNGGENRGDETPSSGQLWLYDLEGKEDRTLAGFIIARMAESGVTFNQFITRLCGDNESLIGTFSEQFWRVLSYDYEDQESAPYSITPNLGARMAAVLGLDNKQTSSLQKKASYVSHIPGCEIINLPEEIRVDTRFDQSHLLQKLMQHQEAKGPAVEEAYARRVAQYEALITARTALYDALKNLTEGTIDTPEKLAEHTEIPIDVLMGYRLPRRKETEKWKPLTSLDDDQRAEFLSLLNAMMSCVIPPSKKESTEVSASMLDLTHHLLDSRISSGREAINAEWIQLRQNLIAGFVERGKTTAEAEAEADRYVVMRKPITGSATWHLTEEGKPLYHNKLFGKGGRLEFENAKQGEVSASMLQLNPDLLDSRFCGHSQTINGEWIQLRQNLIVGLVGAGKTTAEAEAEADRYVVRRKPTVGLSVWYLTEEGKDLYRSMIFGPGGRLEFENRKPEEISANQLMLNATLLDRRFSGGGKRVNEEFIQLREELIEVFSRAGKPPEDAKKEADHYVLMRKPRKGHGPAAWHLTQEGKELYRSMVFGPGGRLEFENPGPGEISVDMLCTNSCFVHHRNLKPLFNTFVLNLTTHASEQLQFLCPTRKTTVENTPHLTGEGLTAFVKEYGHKVLRRREKETDEDFRARINGFDGTAFIAEHFPENLGAAEKKVRRCRAKSPAGQQPS